MPLNRAAFLAITRIFSCRSSAISDVTTSSRLKDCTSRMPFTYSPKAPLISPNFCSETHNVSEILYCIRRELRKYMRELTFFDVESPPFIKAQFKASVTAMSGMVATKASANCHAAINAMINPANSAVNELTVEPVPWPTVSRISLISTARRDVRTPRAFAGSSNQPISCLSKLRK